MAHSSCNLDVSDSDLLFLGNNRAVHEHVVEEEELAGTRSLATHLDSIESRRFMMRKIKLTFVRTPSPMRMRPLRESFVAGAAKHLSIAATRSALPLELADHR